MKTLPIGRYRFFQRLQPLFLLSKITNQPATGYLQVFSSATSWLLYLEEGKLIYACYADNMFELLYRHLQRLSHQVPTLHSGIYKQLRAIFETGIENQAIPNPDYLAICWLVKQKYISPAQAGVLIEQLAIEVLESFLGLKEGSYEFTQESFLDDMPKFCHLDLRLLVEHCQRKSGHPESSGLLGVQQPSFQSIRQRVQQLQTKTEPPCIKPNSSQTTESSHQNLSSHGNNNENNHQSIFQKTTERKLYTVICIDDSPIIVNAIKNFLDDQMFSVVGLNDPLKALMQIIRIKPDIILLDIEMPNLDGYELCSLLRRHSHFQNVPVIMITGRTGFIDRAKAKMVRSSGYLTKPFTQVDLLKVIFQHIG